MQGHPQVIDCLKDLLRGELGARDQYFLHSRLYEDQGLPRLYERLNHEMYGYDGSGSWSFTDEYRDGFRARLVGEVGQLKLKVYELDVAK